MTDISSGDIKGLTSRINCAGGNGRKRTGTIIIGISINRKGTSSGRDRIVNGDAVNGGSDVPAAVKLIPPVVASNVMPAADVSVTPAATVRRPVPVPALLSSSASIKSAPTSVSMSTLALTATFGLNVQGVKRRLSGRKRDRASSINRQVSNSITIRGADIVDRHIASGSQLQRRCSQQLKFGTRKLEAT